MGQYPALVRIMGKNPKVGKVWLDVKFPDGPPQEYSRTGIEIADEFIALSEQRLTQEEYHRNMCLVWPTGMVSSLYAYWQTMWTFHSQKIRAALGIDSKAPQPGSPEHRLNLMLQMVQKQQAARDAGTLGKTQTNPESSGAQAGRGMESTTAEQATRSPTTASGSSSGDKKWYMPSANPNGRQPEQLTATAMFVSTLLKSWTHTNREPPRGTFIVAGLVQMRGERAAVTLDVQAFYDPKASKFVAINTSPRSVKRWTQTPRGGP